jgi:hypothetical protein
MISSMAINQERKPGERRLFAETLKDGNTEPILPYSVLPFFRASAMMLSHFRASAIVLPFLSSSVISLCVLRFASRAFFGLDIGPAYAESL